MAGAGVPLLHYRQHRGAGVLLICNACCASRVLPLEPVIRRLRVRGVGGPTTGIRSLAGFVRENCPRCGAHRWETRPYFPPRPDQFADVGKMIPESKKRPRPKPGAKSFGHCRCAANLSR